MSLISVMTDDSPTRYEFDYVIETACTQTITILTIRNRLSILEEIIKEEQEKHSEASTTT